jgi:hypothetical protein
MLGWRKKKKLKKIKFLRYDVTKWRHNVNFSVDLESVYQDLSYDIQHDIVPYGTFDFKIWLWGKQISTRSETHEGQSRSAPKINQLSGSSDATLAPKLELIW